MLCRHALRLQQVEYRRCPGVERRCLQARDEPLCSLNTSLCSSKHSPAHATQESRKIKAHFLEAYCIAMLAALRLPFTRRGTPDCRVGIEKMFNKNAALRELLAAEGCAILWFPCS